MSDFFSLLELLALAFICQSVYEIRKDLRKIGNMMANIRND